MAAARSGSSPGPRPRDPRLGQPGDLRRRRAGDRGEDLLARLLDGEGADRRSRRRWGAVASWARSRSRTASATARRVRIPVRVPPSVTGRPSRPLRWRCPRAAPRGISGPTLGSASPRIIRSSARVWGQRSRRTRRTCRAPIIPSRSSPRTTGTEADEPPRRIWSAKVSSVRPGGTPDTSRSMTSPTWMPSSNRSASALRSTARALETMNQPHNASMSPSNVPMTRMLTTPSVEKDAEISAAAGGDPEPSVGVAGPCPGDGPDDAAAIEREGGQQVRRPRAPNSGRRR